MISCCRLVQSVIAAFLGLGRVNVDPRLTTLAVALEHLAVSDSLVDSKRPTPRRHMRNVVLDEALCQEPTTAADAAFS